MAPEADPSASESSGAAADERAYVEYGERLREAVAVALGPWLNHQLSVRFGLDAATTQAKIAEVVADADQRLMELIHADVDMPLSGPLERIRSAVEKLSPVLKENGIEPPPRDPFDSRVRPNDWYSLGPLTFLDLGDEVHNAGITWGAAKAYLHQARRK